VIGGNTELKPEQADTYSIGMTYSAPQLGLVAGLDYYSIKVEDVIGSIPGAFLFQQCLDTADPRYCSQIVRTPLGALTGASVATGGYILQTATNIAQVTLNGIDVQLSYSLPLGDRWGSLAFALNGATVLESTTTPAPGAGSFDCTGLFGTICGVITPDWRHNLRMSWLSPWDVELSLNWRYIGGTKLDTNDSDPDLNNGSFDSFNRRLPSVSYIDLSALWSFGEGSTVRVGINNVLDKDPPLISTEVSGTGSPNTFPTYDILGRQAFVGFTQRF
jgi:outer membrane receptor protein involved in Fe transport